MTEISIKNLRKSYGSLEVLRDVNLEINDGEFIVFVGRSGCGKSTLLRSIAGLEPISQGTIRIGGRDVTRLPPSKRRIAMVFQSYALYPHMTVRENMGFSLKLSKSGQVEREKIVNRAAETLQLEEYLDRKPAQLSGGQRQRVAIGRAIVRDPEVFLFDEPLSNLDADLRVQMRAELIQLHASLKATMVYVTHDQVEAMTMADRIVVLNAGKIEQVGTPQELYDAPRNEFVAGFIGSPKMNILPVASASRENDGLVLTINRNSHIRLDGNLPDMDPIKIGIRPEHLVLVNPENAQLSGTITLVEGLGSDSFLSVDIGIERNITVRQVGSSAHKAGDRVFITPQSKHVHLFGNDGARATK